jgi:SMI1/KNR4 family protein SUKH-1
VEPATSGTLGDVTAVSYRLVVTDENLIELARHLEPLAEFREAASAADVADTERRLGVRIPEDLRGFLLSSNGASIGVALKSGGVIERASPLVWSLSQILRENAALALGGAPGTDILYFADVGVDGLLLGHPLDPTGEALDEVVVWYPIEKRRSTIASSFRGYLEGWLSGALKV